MTDGTRYINLRFEIQHLFPSEIGKADAAVDARRLLNSINFDLESRGNKMALLASPAMRVCNGGSVMVGRRFAAVVAGICLCSTLLGCGEKIASENLEMTEKKPMERVDGDASELPGAVVIRPRRNPNMVYDPETMRVTDMKTGESFGNKMVLAMGQLYRAGIRDADGQVLYVYELKYGASRNPNGSIKRVAWQVLWALRGKDAFGNIADVQIPGRERARRDSLERLAQFLRARYEGIYAAQGRAVEGGGEVVIVDRRMYDNSMETMR